MKTNVLVVMLVALAACAGCATQFMGTAPAQQAGSTYVAGSESNQAAIWLCPANGSECQQVEVTE